MESSLNYLSDFPGPRLRLQHAGRLHERRLHATRHDAPRQPRLLRAPPQDIRVCILDFKLEEEIFEATENDALLQHRKQSRRQGL